jgi:TolB-like protein/DNA-binding winged helix-turn-helix (wHTH) protein/Flp pilus assembly protein TadD
MGRIPGAEAALDDSASDVLRFEGFVLDLQRRMLFEGQREIELRPKAFDLLAWLARRAGQVVTKDELLGGVWPGVVVTEESLSRCVSDIRAALGDEGQRLLKTIPRRGYMLAAPAQTAQPAAPAPAPPRRWRIPAVIGAVAAALVAAAAWFAPRPPPERPAFSIVVMPMASRGTDPLQQDLAEAVTEEITVDLSRIVDSFVIGRSTADSYRGRAVDARQVGRELGVRYVLEGTVDRLGDAVRLTLQLVDAQSGRALWAERFEGELRELDVLHRRVTGTVAQRLELRLLEVESDRAMSRRPADLQAQDLALRAWSLLRRRSEDDNAAARELLLQAVEREPQSAFAWALLAESYATDVSLRTTNASRAGATRAQWLARGAEAAQHAHRLEPYRPRVLSVRAFIFALQGRGEEALAEVRRLLEINRNDAMGWFRLCYTSTTVGRPEEAIGACNEAVRLSPRDSWLPGFYVVLAAAHLHLERDAEALAWARKSAAAQPTFSVAHSWVASAAAQLGDMDAARAALAEFRRLRPDYTVRSFREEKLCANTACERQRERYFDGLRRAGLPE